MSSTLYLYCEKTDEGVALLRSGGKGVSPDGDYSNRALFSFLAYHNALGLIDTSFKIGEITEMTNFKGAHFVSNIEELNYQKELLEGLEDNPRFVLLWDSQSCIELAARNPEVSTPLSEYDFGMHTLKNI